MPNVNNARDRLARNALARLGKSIFVRGLEYTAIISDEEYEDEAGIKRELTASFDYKQGIEFSIGDPVFFDGKAFTIAKLPRENIIDQFYTVDLKRA